MIGFKIVDDIRKKDEVVELSKYKHLNSEFAAYKNNIEFQDEIKKMDFNFTFYHLNHWNYTLLDLIRKKSYFISELEKDMKIGEDFKIKNFVLHINNIMYTQRQNMKVEYFNLVKSAISDINKICIEKDIYIYLENLFENTLIMNDIYDYIITNNLNRIGFTFDSGHGKVWSGDTFSQWKIFLNKLEDNKIKKHFHLHTNNGIFDDHLTFSKLPDIDQFIGKRGYKHEIKQLLLDYPNDDFIIEILSTDIIEDIEYFNE